jgi:hypothetical protein
MYLSIQSIERILRLASMHVKRDAQSSAFSLLCTVDYGHACRFASSDWNDPSLSPLCEAILDEVGWKIVEHSARREVIIRCTVPHSIPENAQCTIDRGDGPQPLPVRNREVRSTP